MKHIHGVKHLQNSVIRPEQVVNNNLSGGVNKIF